MGLDINAVQFLIVARKRGLDLGRVLTLGRQDLNVFPSKMMHLLEQHGLPSTLFQPNAPDTKFAEPVFRTLGAKEIVSLDVSSFEGASIVHDLNRPIGPELREQFDLVYDGGTLEHVFNFPVALQSCMELTRIGGRVFIHTVANNYCGHGFYQFGPELFFRAFSAPNGFAIERMVLHAIGPYGRWYEVSDPEQIHARVELITLLPMQLLIQAKRIKREQIFATPPQQSDFVPRWEDQPTGHTTGRGTEAASVAYGAPRPKLAKILPGLARLLNAAKIGVGLLRSHSVRNRKSFRPVKRGS
jgi:hypothetical protein